MGLQDVRHVILVLSGKGGVGKSSVTVQLAMSLSQQGHNIGVLDVDLTGPSIPRLLGLEDKKVRQAPGGWLPVEVHPATLPSVSNGDLSGSHSDPHPESVHAQPQPTTSSTPPSPQRRGSLHAISLAFLLPTRSSAVIWRGPKKTAMIRQFLSDVLWPPNTDYLLIDTPPGTSDEHIALVEEMHKLSLPTTSGQEVGRVGKLMGAMIVTTPQAISVSDVRKELNFCVKTSVPVLGVIENMAGYMCPCCGEVTNIFSKGGGEVMAKDAGVEFWGSVPIDTEFGGLVEGGGSGKELLVERYRSCRLCPIFEGFAKRIERLER